MTISDHSQSNVFQAEFPNPEVETQTQTQIQSQAKSPQWFEEHLDSNLKWSLKLNSILHAETTEYQDIALLDTKYFGKVLVIDGMLQSAERDEFIYHECLVHPALLLHENPKNVFIMGGGEGSTAREALKHSSIEKVVMCDIDKVVVDFCRMHLTANQKAFSDERLHCIINDAKAELENTNAKYDIIIGDLADPIDGGPCNKLYTKSFYQQVIKNRLNHCGIFATQAGPAGILSHKVVFTSIYNTIKQVFKYVVAYAAHVPSYADSCGFILASDQPFNFEMKEIDKRIEERIGGDLKFLYGAFILSSTVLNKTIRTSMLNETHVFTEGYADRFLHGHGVAEDSA